MSTSSARLYVAGPMTGIPEFNFRRFFAVAGALRAFGYYVENPAENDGLDLQTALDNAAKSKHEYEYYMRQDIVRLAKCDGVVMLPGWRQSRGANLEYTIARDLGMPVYTFNDFRLEPLFTVVGLSGYAGCGKDTAAEEFLRQGFERIAFADVLKGVLVALDPFIDRHGTRLSVALRGAELDALKRDTDTDVRVLLQRIGTEVGRNILGENVWVDAAFRKMQDGGKYVITDTRFPNEAKAVTACGGQVWRIERNGVGPANDHPSEHALKDWRFDRHVLNNGSVESLHNRVLHHLTIEGLVAA